MNKVYIGLGSNLAKPEQQLKGALKAMDELSGTELLAHSSFYASLPMGPIDQPNYVNAVALLDTALSPMALLEATQTIEKNHGRIRKDERWGPRTLDLDILLYGQIKMESDALTIPHYGMKEREFVLYPLIELAPGLVLPDGEKLSQLVANCALNGLQKIPDTAQF